MKNDQSPTLMPRRRFLIVGSAAVATAAATSLSATEMLRSALVFEEISPQLSAGFIDAKLEDFSRSLFAPRLAAASKLRSGDAALANGVRLTVHGLVRPDAATGKSLVAGLDAMYRVAGRSEAVPFLAWSRASLGQNETRPASPFVVPVSAKHPLSLTVLTSASAKQPEQLRFAIDAHRGANKLRTGLYFVAVVPAGMKAPEWSSVRAVRTDQSDLPVLQQVTVLGYERVAFEYLVINSTLA
jgi:hypothetical protein